MKTNNDQPAFARCYAPASAVEVVQDTRSIGGVESCHICFGTIDYYTPTQVVIINAHGNKMRFYTATNRMVGAAYPELPYRLIKC